MQLPRLNLILTKPNCQQVRLVRFHAIDICLTIFTRFNSTRFYAISNNYTDEEEPSPHRCIYTQSNVANYNRVICETDSILGGNQRPTKALDSSLRLNALNNSSTLHRDGLRKPVTCT